MWNNTTKENKNKILKSWCLNVTNDMTPLLFIKATCQLLVKFPPGGDKIPHVFFLIYWMTSVIPKQEPITAPGWRESLETNVSLRFKDARGAPERGETSIKGFLVPSQIAPFVALLSGVTLTSKRSNASRKRSFRHNLQRKIQTNVEDFTYSKTTPFLKIYTFYVECVLKMK